MNKELQKSFNDEIEENYHYKEFLSKLGINPEDFEDEYEIEMDDYSK